MGITSEECVTTVSRRACGGLLARQARTHSAQAGVQRGPTGTINPQRTSAKAATLNKAGAGLPTPSLGKLHGSRSPQSATHYKGR